MSKVLLQYIGPKDRHVDALYDTGDWLPDEKKLVDRETASYMLMHPDVWKDARSAAARKKEPITPMARPQQYKHHKLDQEPAMANLMAMDKAALAMYAQREFSTRIPAESMSEQQVRDRVHSLIRSRS
jgi:hypothetical protein